MVDVAPDPGQFLVLGGAHGVEPARRVEDDPEDSGLGELEIQARVVAVAHGVRLLSDRSEEGGKDEGDHHYQECRPLSPRGPGPGRWTGQNRGSRPDELS